MFPLPVHSFVKDVGREEGVIYDSSACEEDHALTILHLVGVVPHARLLLRRVGSVERKDKVTTVGEYAERLCSVDIVALCRNLDKRNAVEVELLTDICRATSILQQAVLFEVEEVRIVDVGAYEVGKVLAEKAKAKKITAVVFDRGGYLYTGRVQSLADGAREGGLTF